MQYIHKLYIPARNNTTIVNNVYMHINVDRGWDIITPNMSLDSDYTVKLINKYKIDLDTISSLTINISLEAYRFNFLYLHELCDRCPQLSADSIHIITGNFKQFHYYNAWKAQVRPSDPSIRFTVKMLFTRFYGERLFSNLVGRKELHDRCQVVTGQKTFERAYNFLAGAPRASRTSMLKRLIDNKLINRGLIGFNNTNDAGMFNESVDCELPIPLDIDSSSLNDFNNKIAATVNSIQFSSLTDPDYKHVNYFSDIIHNSFVSLVCETETGIPDDNIYDNSAPIYDCYANGFITEKTFRTIMHGHPMLWYSSTYTIDFLKYMGFRTFSNWWDESYDNIHNPLERMDAVIEVLRELCAKKPEQLRQMHSEMTETLYYNRSVLDKMVAVPQYTTAHFEEYSRNWEFPKLSELKV